MLADLVGGDRLDRGNRRIPRCAGQKRHLAEEVAGEEVGNRFAADLDRDLAALDHEHRFARLALADQGLAGG